MSDTPETRVQDQETPVHLPTVATSAGQLLNQGTASPAEASSSPDDKIPIIIGRTGVGGRKFLVPKGWSMARFCEEQKISLKGQQIWLNERQISHTDELQYMGLYFIVPNAVNA